MIAPTVTVAEVADALGLSPSTVYERARTGAIPNVGLGRAVRIPRVWLNRHLTAHGGEAPMVIEVEDGTFT